MSSCVTKLNDTKRVRFSVHISRSAAARSQYLYFHESNVGQLRERRRKRLKLDTSSVEHTVVLSIMCSCVPKRLQMSIKPDYRLAKSGRIQEYYLALVRCYCGSKDGVTGPNSRGSAVLKVCDLLCIRTRIIG